MPLGFGDDSDLCQMLRLISPWFEHKLFLTATPHNGHTRCFTGLLEQLDPVRFTQTRRAIPDADAPRIEQIVVVRRLKREINDLDRAPGNVARRFSERTPEPLPLYFSGAERRSSHAFAAFRTAVQGLVAGADAATGWPACFAVEVLGKRLLSCPAAFAESWRSASRGPGPNERGVCRR